MIEPAASTFDWSLFDSGLASASAAGKKVSLSIAAGGFCPDWLTGTQTLPLQVMTHFAGAQTTTYVVPWDPVFQAQWSAAIAAFGARYDSNPSVSYVYIGGPGDYIESFVVQNETDYAAFSAAGGLTAWTSAVEKIIDMYAAAFPTTPFMLALGNPVNVPGDPVAYQAGLTALQAVVNYGFTQYPGRFGVVNQGLSSDSVLSVLPTSTDAYKTSLVAQTEVYSPCGFQMNSVMGSDLGAALDAGIALDPQAFIEVYKADCLDSANTDILQAANSELNPP